MFNDASYSCKHHEWEQRAWVANLPRPELELALENGYVVKRLFRSYWFSDWDSTLFKEYIQKFLKVD